MSREIDRECIISYTEAWRILQLLPQREKELIPPEAMAFLDKYKDLSLGNKIDLLEPLERQQISKSALCVVGGILIRTRWVQISKIHRLLKLRQEQMEQD